MRQPRILMCPPDYYGIEYEINPWMSRARASTPERAHRQWRALHDALLHIGADVELENCVIWDDAEIASGARLRGCIVRDHCAASGSHADRDF